MAQSNNNNPKMMVIDASNSTKSKKKSNDKFAQMLSKMGKRSISTAKNDANRRLETQSSITAKSVTIFDEFANALSLDPKKRRALDPQYYLDFIVLLTLSYCGEDQIISLYSETNNIATAEYDKENESRKEYEKLVNEKNDIFAKGRDFEEIEMKIENFKQYNAQKWHLTNIELLIPIAVNSLTMKEQDYTESDEKENKNKNENEMKKNEELTENNNKIALMNDDNKSENGESGDSVNGLTYEFAVFGTQKLLPFKRYPYYLDLHYQWNIWNSIEMLPRRVWDDETNRYLHKYEDMLACVILCNNDYNVCVFSTRNGVFRSMNEKEKKLFNCKKAKENSNQDSEESDESNSNYCIKLSNHVIYSFWVQEEGVFGIAKNPTLYKIELFENKDFKERENGKNKAKEEKKKDDSKNDETKSDETNDDKNDKYSQMNDKTKNENCEYSVVLNIISESSAHTPYADIVSFSFDWDRVIGAYYDVNMGIVYFAFQGKGMSFEYSSRYLQSKYIYSSDYGTRAGRNIFAFNCNKRVLDDDFALAYRSCLIDSLKSSFNNDISNFDSDHVLKEQGWCFFADISHKCLFYVSQKYTMRISLKMFDEFKKWTEKRNLKEKEKEKENDNQNDKQNDKAKEKDNSSSNNDDNKANNSSKNNSKSKRKSSKISQARKKMKESSSQLSRWSEWIKMKRNNRKNDKNDKNEENDKPAPKAQTQEKTMATAKNEGNNDSVTTNNKEEKEKEKENENSNEKLSEKSNMIKIVSTNAMLPGLGNSLTKCMFLYNQTTFVSLCKIGVSGKVPYVLRTYTESLHQFAKHD